jgi:hypothetical protein
MRVSRRVGGVLALAALLLPLTAHANELLVMPYSCTMVAGQPLLTPGPEQGHRVIGQRDQRRFSACSPANPALCRHWTVHRFDLDCDGSRVPWVSMVAATNEGSRGAWLLDGRLVLRMGPQWSLPPDDPCAQEPGAERRFEYRRMRRYCADRLALAPPPVVEMPFGYAPMLGINGIFVKAAPNVAGGVPPLPPIAAAPRGANPPAPNPMAELFPSDAQSERSEPPRDAVAEAPRPAPAAPAQIVPQPQAPPNVAAPIPPPAFEEPIVTPAEGRLAPSETKPAPKIATNAPAPKAAEAPPAPVAAPPAAPKTSPVAAKPAAPETPKVAISAPVPPKAVERPVSPPGQAAAPEGGGFNLLSVFRTTTVGALVAFGGLALGLLTAFALARRNENIRDSRRRPRDLGSLSLDNKRARPPARVGNVRGNLPPNAAASAMSRSPGQAAAESGPAQWGDRMPQTTAEAMQMLGIGVAPTANEAAIKKIVDGLRQSWHPDHAKDEGDRAMRELRSKQINAAWELLRSQRATV